MYLFVRDISFQVYIFIFLSFAINALNIFYFGKPAYEMHKLDIGWSPSQHLGHDKLKLDSAKLAEAQQRANRVAIRAERREKILGRPDLMKHVVQRMRILKILKHMTSKLKLTTQEIFLLIFSRKNTS